MTSWRAPPLRGPKNLRGSATSLLLRPSRAGVEFTRASNARLSDRLAMPSSADVCASLCDDVADAVHPDHDFLARHGADVTSTADAMLARLDELAAMLGTLRAEGREQREALEPVLEAFAAGLARDFAYIDSVEDTVSAIRTAVTTTENQLSALESTHFKNARLAEVESARRGIENLFTRVGGVTADLGRAGGTLAGGFAAFSTELAASATSTARSAAAAAAVAAAARPASISSRAPHWDEETPGRYYEEDDAAPEGESGGARGMVETLSGRVGRVTEGLASTLGRYRGGADGGGDGDGDDGPVGNIPTAS